MCVGLAKNSGAFVFGCPFPRPYRTVRSGGFVSFFWANKRKKANLKIERRNLLYLLTHAIKKPAF
jgi:hypothetical protein